MSTDVPVAAPRRLVSFTVDGEPVTVPEGSTILDACRAVGKDIPTLCYGDTLTPVNACRVCMVEGEGSRVLVPSCSRRVEAGMVVTTESERARAARKMVLEVLGSSVDLSTTPGVTAWNDRYGAAPSRYGPPAVATDRARDRSHAGEHTPNGGGVASTVA